MTSKILEHVVSSRVYHCLTAYAFLSPKQYGFQKHNSTVVVEKLRSPHPTSYYSAAHHCDYRTVKERMSYLLIFKISKVVPLHNNRNTTYINNYRPITSKILGRVVSSRVYHCLTAHGFLSPKQYGFQKHHSTLVDYMMSWI